MRWIFELSTMASAEDESKQSGDYMPAQYLSTDDPFVFAEEGQSEGQSSTGASAAIRSREFEGSQRHESISMESKINSILCNTPLMINIGGTTFMTTKEVLCQSKESLFSCLLNSNNIKPHYIDNNSKLECYFIDRDGKYFNYILNYLRNKKLLLPNNSDDRVDVINHLIEEAEYYNLWSLLKMLNGIKYKHTMSQMLNLNNLGCKLALHKKFTISDQKNIENILHHYNDKISFSYLIPNKIEWNVLFHGSNIDNNGWWPMFVSSITKAQKTCTNKNKNKNENENLLCIFITNGDTYAMFFENGLQFNTLISRGGGKYTMDAGSDGMIPSKMVIINLTKNLVTTNNGETYLCVSDVDKVTMGGLFRFAWYGILDVTVKKGKSDKKYKFKEHKVVVQYNQSLGVCRLTFTKHMPIVISVIAYTLKSV